MTYTDPTSFVYEDLVSHIQAIHFQMIEGMKYLDNRWNNEEKIHDQLKSHSLSIIDPYGNPMTKQYMDHDLISTVLKNFKKNYVPKYLHQWIQFGHLIGNRIQPLKESNLSSIVAQYRSEYPIITYGEITVWTGDWETVLPYRLSLEARLTDNMANIQMQIKGRTNQTLIELKACIIEKNSRPTQMNWDAGTTLTSEDTIMSKHLYQENCIIMVKVAMEKVNRQNICLVLEDFSLFVGQYQRFVSNFSDIHQKSYWENDHY